MKKKALNPTKLTLNRETLHALNLTSVLGGIPMNDEDNNKPATEITQGGFTCLTSCTV